jgi:hypothetical protein
MPTPRQSLTELAHTGTLGKNRDRYQSRIASRTTVITPLGKAPVHLSATERSIWAEVVRCAPPGLLTKSDRLSLEIVVRLVACVRSPEAKSGDSTVLMALLGHFGMNPSDRYKMALEPPPEPKAQSDEEARLAELDELD